MLNSTKYTPRMASRSLDSVLKRILVLKIKFDRVHIVLSEIVYCRLCIKSSPYCPTTRIELFLTHPDRMPALSYLAQH